MKLPFREHHLLILLKQYDQQDAPLDVFMSQYFRANKAIGSKDRGVIADIAYGMVRWQGLLDFLCTKPLSWEKRYEIFQQNFREESKDKDIPLHIKLSFPKHLFDHIARSHGFEKASAICESSNKAAPTTVRVNPLKTTRDELLEKWRKDGYQVVRCSHSSFGITFLKKINFFSLLEFKQGLFEIQDEGSQLIAELIRTKPGDLVLDYCSGSGGKTLAFAYKMQNRGQIFLHDIRPWALMECRKRLRRAGIQNAQIALADDPKLKKLKKQMDWVLVDAPCSGTGTLRRNPDMKWKFTDEAFQRLLGQQRMIFEKALSYLKPQGKIVYATCSLLKEENESQVEHFIKTYDLKLSEPPFVSLPKDKGMDGFYGAVLEKRSSLQT